MRRRSDAPSRSIRTAWHRLAGVPGGRWLFSRLIGWLAPYTGSMGATVVALEPGYARVELTDRRRVRNHLDSIHAVALMNLAELATGLAVVTGLPETARGIVTGLSITYHKKARGRVIAECRCAIPEVREPVDHEVGAIITDEAGDVVARAAARWRLGPRPAA